jgi:hypothetical protein
VLGSAVGVEIEAMPLVAPPPVDAPRGKGYPDAIPIRPADQVIFTVDEMEACLMKVGMEDARELEEALERFLYQSPFGQVWRAELLRLELPFLLEWPKKRPPRGMKQRPVVQGVIDLMWGAGKDGGLLWLTTEPFPPDDFPHPGRIFWVHAYHQLTGTWPRRVDAYCLADGSCREESGQEWRGSDLIDRFHEALAARLRESTAQ